MIPTPHQLGLPERAKVYLAGPMRAKPRFNFPAFMQATKLLSESGWDVFNPAQRDVDAGFDPGLALHRQKIEFNLEDAMRADLQWIVDKAQALIVLDGYHGSIGAMHELRTARIIGLPTYHFYSSGLAELRVTLSTQHATIVEDEIIKGVRP